MSGGHNLVPHSLHHVTIEMYMYLGGHFLYIQTTHPVTAGDLQITMEVTLRSMGCTKEETEAEKMRMP